MDGRGDVYGDNISMLLTEAIRYKMRIEWTMS